jgi:anti-sigma factor RsiW
MNCRMIRSQLSPHLDGRLSGTAARRVKSHLAECPLCRAELAELRAVKAILVEAIPPAAPPGFWDALHADLRKQALQQEKRATRGWAARNWARAPLLAAGLAAVLLAAIVPVEYFGPPLSRGGVSVDEMIAGHAGYCAQQPLLEDGRMHYLVAEADTTAAE